MQVLPNKLSAPIERRERRRVSMHGFVMLPDKTNHEVLVLDLSYEGCGIQTAAELHFGQKVKLSVLRRGGIDAEVRWCGDGKAGLAFAPSSAPPKKHWPRKSQRLQLGAEITLRRIGHSSFRVAVVDASPHGCKVELVERPRPGDQVLVKFDGLEPLQAEVMWIEGHVAGLAFDKAMHPAVFDLLIERLKG